jgi:hypothetical protein
MSGNKNSGRKRKMNNGVRTSIYIDAPTLSAIRFMAGKEKLSSGAIVMLAIEEYFLKHYEKELEGMKDASND